ncbi:MAG: RNA polymerase sigma factor [Acidithiobacillales bacterium]
MSHGAADPGVIQALVENHRRFLAFLERRVGDRDAAEEILQAAFVKVIERAGEIRDDERAVAWFYRLLRNALVDHWRSHAARRRGEEALARELGGAFEPAPEVGGEICRCFEPLLPTLGADYEAVLRRVDLEGVRPVDFAAEAGITPNNAMVRLHRARRALREQMLRSCRTCAEHGCLDCSCGGPTSGRNARCKGKPPNPSALSEGEKQVRPTASHPTEKSGRKGGGS